MGGSIMHGRKSGGSTRPLRAIAPNTDDGNAILQVAAVGSVSPSFSGVSRPNGATVYTANQIVLDEEGASDTLEWDNLVAEAGAGGYITKVLLATSQQSCTARFRIWFFNVPIASLASPPPDSTAQALNLAAADFTNGRVVGYVDLPACADVGAVAMAQAFPVLHFVTNGSVRLYGIIEALDGFTADANQDFYVLIGIERG
jgi:hypothetical protein